MIGAIITRVGTPAAASCANGLEASAGSARSGLHPPSEFFVERGDAERNMDEALLGHRREQVEVAGHEPVLGDDSDGLPCLGRHLQTAASQLESPFGRLVAVGDPRKANHLRLSSRRARASGRTIP